MGQHTYLGGSNLTGPATERCFMDSECNGTGDHSPLSAQYLAREKMGPPPLSHDPAAIHRQLNTSLRKCRPRAVA